MAIKMSFTGILLKKTVLTHNVLVLQVEKPKNFTFVAGQFIQLQIPVGDTCVYRAYSISSAPHMAYLEFCVHLFPDGIGANYLSSTAVGTTFIFSAALGNFVHAASDLSPIYGIATGVGIAPVMSLITDELIAKKNTTPIRLLLGFRSEEDIFWQDRFETLSKTYSNFSYQITLSQPKQSHPAILDGRVTSHMPPEKIIDHFYLCGSVAMVKDVRNHLLSIGTATKAIHFEIF